MLDSMFASSVIETFNLQSTLLVIGCALILGLLISQVYMGTHKKEGYIGSFVVTLIMLPVIIAMIILLVGNNVARAFSLAGAFSLIRFRSAPGDPKDIAYVFFTLAVGLACGMGFVGYAALFAIILCVVMIILSMTQYGMPQNTAMKLKIMVPEDMDYEGLFDDIFKQYTKEYKVLRVKTADFGALFEIIYYISMKDDVKQKEFIDHLRCRNGNLSITLTTRPVEEKI